jgi:hypothetical protein
MSVSLSPILNGYQSFLSTGLPNNGGFIYTYLAGTTTPAATYTTNSGGTPNANPIPLSADGRPPQEIWLTDGTAYKLVVMDSTTAPITGASFDNITGIGSASFPASLSASGGSALVGFLQAGTGAVARTVQSKLRDIVNTQDFGTDFGSSLATAITAFPLVEISSGSPVNTTTPVTIPLTKGIIRNSALITSSGSGTLVNSGVDIGYLNNPSGLSNWTTTTAQNYEGISADLGGYGVRQFGTHPNIIGITGSVNIPATAANSGNGIGIAGYVKNAAPTGGAGTNGVAVYGEANCEATNSLIWGFNSRSIDNGFATTVWGGEFDVNLTNAASIAKGIDIVGGSTVEPAVTIGLRIGPLGTFSSPPKRWARGIFIDDASSITGIEIGTANVPGGSAGGTMPINFYFNPNSSGRALAANFTCDGSGNFTLAQAYSGALFNLVVGGPAGTGLTAMSMIKSGSNVGLSFYGQSPAGKQTVSGSKGGNAALSSLMSALSAIGLFTDSTT